MRPRFVPASVPAAIRTVRATASSRPGQASGPRCVPGPPLASSGGPGHIGVARSIDVATRSRRTIMLKRIPPILSPELLYLIARMGHGDELVIADANFPAVAIAKRLVRADGHGVPVILEAILQLFPLDSFVTNPAAVMRRVDKPGEPAPIWNDFQRLLDSAKRGISRSNRSNASRSTSAPGRASASSPPVRRPCTATSSSRRA